MKTVTKRDLVVQISNETGMTQQQVFDVIQKTLDTITTTLAGGDEVVLRNFGSFQVRETKQKIGRNPNKPDTDVIIPPRAIVKFKPGKEMKERVANVLPQIQNQETTEAPPAAATPSPETGSL
ncbi:MAG: HU family DNA-binding protein [Verrucomicrobiales bacterium]|nr:HU family DNA-binding protein [Verrucomicrobiales bacterium]MED5587129.1 HU family DNA-binding protein [Verrucomicrobiota bacterium]